jgi:nitric oxide reductase subunit B
MNTNTVWKDKWIAVSFWSINIGLALMVLISVLPIGILQTWASVKYGLWYARSMEFMQEPIMDTLRWLRAIGDTIFAVGIVALGWFIAGLKTGWSLEKPTTDNTPNTDPAPTSRPVPGKKDKEEIEEYA